jgi:hypothetical protein
MKNLCVLFACVCLSGVAVAKESGWIQVRPSEGISVKMPSTPKNSQRNEDTPIGRIHAEIFTATMPWGSYTVAYTDLPAAAALVAVTSPDEVFNEARGVVLHEANAEETGYTDAARYHRAKDLAYQNSSQQGWARMVLLGARLFIADVRLKRGEPKAKYADPFLASLSFQRVRKTRTAP